MKSRKPLKLPTLTTIEWTTLVLSLSALGVSLWSVAESRNAMLLTRRAEVRATMAETLEYIRSTYSSAACTIQVAKQQPQAEQMTQKYKKSAEVIDSMRASIDVIQAADFDVLNRLEKDADMIHAAFRRMKDSTSSFKQHMTDEELARVTSICEATS